MDDGRALFVAQVIIENTAHVRGVGYVDGARVLLRQLMGIIHPVAGLGGGSEGLEREVFAVGGEALVQPNVLPAGTGHVIAKPLVEQFVGREREIEPVLRGHRLVLHAAVNGHHVMAVLLIREGIEAGQIRVVFDEAGRQVDARLPIGEVRRRVDVVDDGDGGATRGVRVVHIFHVRRDGHKNQVVIHGVARLPFVAHLVVGQRYGAGQHAVRAYFVGQSRRHPHVAGVSFVGEHLLAREPLVRRKWLRQRPGDVVGEGGRPVVGVEVHRAGGTQAIADGGRIAAGRRAVVVDAGIGQGAGGGGHRQPGRGVIARAADAGRAPAVHHHRVDEQRGRAGWRARRRLVQLKRQRIEGLAAHLHPHPHHASHVQRVVLHGQVQLVVFHVVALHLGPVRDR